MQIKNFIDNQFHPAIEGQWLDNICPHNETVSGQIAASTAPDVAQAVEAASRAFVTWKQTSPSQRAQLMQRLAQLLTREAQNLAAAESKDQGKTLVQAQRELPRAAQNLQFFSQAVEKWTQSPPPYAREKGDENPPESQNHLQRIPLGVVVTISPWNLPLYLLTWKLAPAIATGNCVVAKPSELAPLTAAMFCQLVQEAGFPPGVINVLHGLGSQVGEPLITHPQVRAVSFTGSTQTGRHIYAQAAKSLKKVSLEMGGKNPAIIFADCDFSSTLQTVLRSSFTNQGEICTCNSRVFVQESLYPQFKQHLLAAAPHFEQGAMISQDHLDKVLGYVALARQEGGRIICGGRRQKRPGFYLEPTVIEGLAPRSRINQEEIFGPVITLTPFSTEAQVVEWANGVDYGLSATIHTADETRAQRLAEALEVGMVWVNGWMNRDLSTPFGGIKNSGLGREGGEWSLQFYTEVKNICYTHNPHRNNHRQ